MDHSSCLRIIDLLGWAGGLFEEEVGVEPPPRVSCLFVIRFHASRRVAGAHRQLREERV